MTIAQSAITNALMGYCFETIWDEPQLEYADNVQLIPVVKRFIINWIIGEKYIALPTNGVQYAVYKIDYTLVGNAFIAPSNTWVQSDTIANTYQTLFHVYAANGLMVPKSAVMLYYNSHNNKMYVAIQKAAFMSIIGIANFSQVYMSVYRYLQYNTPLKVTSIYIPNPDTGLAVTTQVNNALAVSYAATTYGTTVYVNGYDIPAAGTMVFTQGSYVDIITDKTVVGLYSVDLTDTNTGYFSTTYNCYKQVLHCPKQFNPNNNLMTVELLSLTCRRNSDQVGLYITKAEKNSLTQITHNDVGLNTDIVTTLKTALNYTDVSIEVKIRYHNRKLIREIDYIEYLYILNDAEILNFLIGSGDASLPFWTAASLEASAYVSYMSAGPAISSTQTLTNYISALGYYTVLSVLCQHVTNIPIVSLPTSNISVRKPLVLSGYSGYPVVYINGSKILDADVGYTNTVHGNILLGFTSAVNPTVGQTVTVDVIEAGSSVPYIFTPSSATPTLTVPFASVSVYQLNTLTTAVTGFDASSVNSLTYIEPLSLSPVQTYVSGTGTELVFTSPAYGNTYIIQNGTFSQIFPFDVTSQVTSLSPIHVELTTVCSDNTTVVPFVGYNSLDVYLNGHKLIAGIDYSAIPINDLNGNISLVQLLICNAQFINLTNTNIVEVLARTAVTLESEIGYLANNLANMKNSVEFWYASMSQFFVGGILQLNPTDNGNSLAPNPTLSNALPFNVLTELPNNITEVLTGYTTTADDSRITLINTYLNNLTPINNTTTLIIPESWNLYSPYLQAIYNQALTTTEFELFTNDPDDKLFLAQFEPWAYLIANDPTVNPSISKIDLRFCDVNPSYGTVSVPDTNTYAILQRLETLMLAKDTNTSGEVVDV